MVCNVPQSNKNDFINAARVYFDVDFNSLDLFLKQFNLGNGPQALQVKDTSLKSQQNFRSEFIEIRTQQDFDRVFNAASEDLQIKLLNNPFALTR